MMIKLAFVLLIIIAVIVVQAEKLRRSVVYLGILSMIGSFAYLLYGAPDVAIAEAVIGSTLSTILFLVALQKYRVFTIYYVHPSAYRLDDNEIRRSRGSLLHLAEQFCINRELEPQIVYTVESPESVKSSHHHDLIVERESDTVRLYGPGHSYLTEGIMTHIEDHMAEVSPLVAVEKVTEDEPPDEDFP